MPVMGSSTCASPGSGAGLTRDLQRVGDRADAPLVLELQEEAIAARRRQRGGEADHARRVRLLGVDVQEGEIALAKRHQVAVGAEVWLDVGDRSSVAAELVLQTGRCPGPRLRGREPGAVAVDRVHGRGGGERDGRERAGDEQVGGQGHRATAGAEVGVGPVHPGGGQAQSHAPGARGVEGGVEMLVSGEVAPDDDQVHAPLVLEIHVGDRPPVGPEDAEAQLGGPAEREGGGLGCQGVAALGDGETGERRRDGLRRMPSSVRVGRVRRMTVPVTASVPEGVERRAGQRGRAERDPDGRGEGRDARPCPHGRTA